ncbi:MAG: hypothetical protein LBF15_05875 [Candidatus Peribacteria bacterium]|nr:hypothetical protein [Candidatus Peribacteria bacterium]
MIVPVLLYQNHTTICQNGVQGACIKIGLQAFTSFFILLNTRLVLFSLLNVDVEFVYHLFFAYCTASFTSGLAAHQTLPSQELFIKSQSSFIIVFVVLTYPLESLVIGAVQGIRFHFHQNIS